jgi:hypothetical protein
MVREPRCVRGQGRRLSHRLLGNEDMCRTSEKSGIADPALRVGERRASATRDVGNMFQASLGLFLRMIGYMRGRLQSEASMSFRDIRLVDLLK